MVLWFYGSKSPSLKTYVLENVSCSKEKQTRGHGGVVGIQFPSYSDTIVVQSSLLPRNHSRLPNMPLITLKRRVYRHPEGLAQILYKNGLSPTKSKSYQPHLYLASPPPPNHPVKPLFIIFMLSSFIFSSFACSSFNHFSPFSRISLSNAI